MNKFFTILISAILGFGLLQAQNVVTNGDFSDGSNGWVIEVQPDHSATFNADSGYAEVVITANDAADNWHIQLAQNGVALRPGQYNVSMDVWASDNKNLTFLLQETTSWSVLTNNNTNVDSAGGWQTWTFTTNFVPTNWTGVKAAFMVSFFEVGDTLRLDNISIEYANLDLVIDGSMDEWYGDLSGPDDGYLQIRHFAWNGNGVQPADDADLSARFYAAWDADWFYFYEEVSDDTLGSDGTATWQNDVMEFKIDAVAVADPTNALVSLGITRDQAATFVDSLGGLAKSAREFVVVEWEGGNGYTIEGKMRWDSLGISTGVGSRFGISIANHDNDNAGQREHSIQWSAVMNDNVWSTVASHGTVEFLDGGMINFIPSNNMTGVTNYLPYDGSDIITIDGEMDNWYNGLTGPADGYLQIRSFHWNGNGTPPADDTDLSAKFWASWDSQWFYFYEEVTDDTLGMDGSATWQNDILEFKIDAIADGADANDHLTSIGMTRSGDTSYANVENIPEGGGDLVRVETDGGYILEGRISWDAMGGDTSITAAANRVFGLSIANHDNDNAGQREHSIQWSAVLVDNVWNNVENHGTVRFLANRKLAFLPSNNITDVENFLPYDGSDRIEIDGEKDRWYEGLTGPADGWLKIDHLHWNGNGVMPRDNDDLSAEFWASWDQNWFYFYEEVTDDTLGMDGSATWQNDILEFKIDAYADGTDANDHLTSIGMTRSGDTSYANVENIPEGGGDLVRVETDGGYILEGRISWDAMGGDTSITAAANRVFGLSIANHDNDNAGQREHSIQWSAVLVDNVWNNVENHGTARFLAGNKMGFIATNNITGVENPLPYDGTVVNAIEDDQINGVVPTVFALEQNFPNPFNPTTTINYSIAKAGKVKLTIFDALGRKVADLVDSNKDIGAYKVSFDASKLASGVYFYQIVAGDFIKTHKMILIK